MGIIELRIVSMLQCTFIYILYDILSHAITSTIWNILFMAPRIKMVVTFKLTLERVCDQDL